MMASAFDSTGNESVAIVMNESKDNVFQRKRYKSRPTDDYFFAQLSC